MIQITKTPILILSAPRTGSSILGSYIQSLSNKQVKYFLEPDFDGPEHINKFNDYRKESNDFILKCHYIHLNQYGSEVTDYLLREAYKIRIRRRNFIKQVASFQIAIERNRQWLYTSKEQYRLKDHVHIDIESIKKSIKYLKEANTSLDNANINFDLDLYYEDLPKFDNLDFCVTPEPLNYHRLLLTVKSLVEESNQL